MNLNPGDDPVHNKVAAASMWSTKQSWSATRIRERRCGQATIQASNRNQISVQQAHGTGYKLNWTSITEHHHVPVFITTVTLSEFTVPVRAWALGRESLEAPAEKCWAANISDCQWLRHLTAGAIFKQTTLGITQLKNTISISSPSPHFQGLQEPEGARGRGLNVTFPFMYLLTGRRYRDGTKCNMHFAPGGNEKPIVRLLF